MERATFGQRARPRACTRSIAPIAVSCDTKDCRSDRSKHQHQRDSPGNVGVALVERFGEIGHGQRDGEEVERVPAPGKEGDEEEEPLLCVEHAQQANGIGCLCHGRPEGGEPSCSITACAHMDIGRINLGQLGLLVHGLSIALVGRRHGAGQRAHEVDGRDRGEEVLQGLSWIV